MKIISQNLPSAINQNALEQLERPLAAGDELEAEDLAELLVVEAVALEARGAARDGQDGEQHEGRAAREVPDPGLRGEHEARQMGQHDAEGGEEARGAVEVELRFYA